MHFSIRVNLYSRATIKQYFNSLSYNTFLCSHLIVPILCLGNSKVVAKKDKLSLILPAARHFLEIREDGINHFSQHTIDEVIRSKLRYFTQPCSWWAITVCCPTNGDVMSWKLLDRSRWSRGREGKN